MSYLHVDSVIKSFGTRQLLTDIFISCKKGEIVGLLGKNGSGKSTLLKIILGAIKSERKFIKVDDHIINNLFENRNFINYLPQNNFLPNHLSIKNIIPIYCDKENENKIKSNSLIKNLLYKKINELSGGEQRIVEIVLIIYSEAKFILIDEPFNGVAPVYKEEIKNLIREESKNKGFIITDHDYRNIFDLSTRLVLLYDGGTKMIKQTKELEYWGYIPEQT